MTNLNQNKGFWKPEPRQHSLLTYSLIIPIVASVLGFFIVGIFAFAFDSINVLSEPIRDWITVFGSALVILGAEANTPGTFVAVFKRLYKNENVNFFDWSAITLSGIGTLANMLIVIAILIDASSTERIQWVSSVLVWMPLVAGFAVSCDYYGSLIELGFHIGSFEKRYEQWLEEKREYEQDLSAADIHEPLAELHNAIGDIQKQLEKMRRPVATIQDTRKIIAGCNGSKSKLTSDKKGLSELEKLLDENGFNVPGERVMRGWLERLGKGKL
jgi:hypothetical protein